MFLDTDEFNMGNHSMTSSNLNLPSNYRDLADLLLINRRTCAHRATDFQMDLSRVRNKTKKACVLCTVVFIDRALEAKNAQDTSGKQNSDGRRKRIKREPNEQRSETSEHSDQNMRYPFGLGVQKVGLFVQNAVV